MCSYFAMKGEHWTHQIQAPLTYLQSSHNLPYRIVSYDGKQQC